MQAKDHATDQTDGQAEDGLHNATPRIRLRSRDTLFLVGLAVVLGGAIGYLVADNTSLNIVARVLASDTIVLLPGAWVAIAVTRRLTRIEAQLHDQIDAEAVGYNRGYMDCLKRRGND